MKVEESFIKDLLIITPTVFEDSRGYFLESYNKNKLKDFVATDFKQDNESSSHKGTLRGLHFQKPPHAQAKLIRVITGSVLDIAVDLRVGSDTYGRYHKIVLSSENKKQVYVPKGFAHGFAVLEDNTIFSYKCSDYYNKESEVSLFWEDPTLNIDWGIENPIISDKDKLGIPFNSFKSPFNK